MDWNRDGKHDWQDDAIFHNVINTDDDASNSTPTGSGHRSGGGSSFYVSQLGKVCDICKKYSFEPMMWSDMFHRIAVEDQELESASFDGSVKSLIPENLTLVYWDYYHITSDFHDGMLKGHKALTENVAYAGGAWKWASFVPNNGLGIESNRIAMQSCIDNGVKDVIITLWGDNFADYPWLYCCVNNFGGWWFE